MSSFKSRINLCHLNDGLARFLTTSLLYEFKDTYTLEVVSRILKGECPGNFKLINWVDPDNTQLEDAFEVIIEFESKEEYVRWMCTWS